MSSVISDLREDYLRRLCGGLVGYRGQVLNMADKDSEPSKELARLMVDKTGQALCPNPPGSGQALGARFAEVVADFLDGALDAMEDLVPWEYAIYTKPSEAQIAGFDQYEHLAELERVRAENPTVATAIGGDYLVTPDVVMVRPPISDEELNAEAEAALVDDSVARLTPLREANDLRPVLHASISCKWTMRSDRAQNTRTEALNLIRNRKGRAPHITAITLEPTPARLASIAEGTGDVDCTYHGLLYELEEAVEESERTSDKEKRRFRRLVEGRRLRDISDLPFDLA